MRSTRDQAVDLLQELQENGVSAQSILDFVLTHSLSGADALFAMRDAKAEFLDDEDEEYEVGMEVEVVDDRDCTNELGDEGIITEMDGDGLLRVTVEGKINSGNWMLPSQVARINY